MLTNFQATAPLQNSEMICVKNKKVKLLIIAFVLCAAVILFISLLHGNSTTGNCRDIIISDGYIYLPSGEIVSLEGSSDIGDSTIKLHDGRIVSPDGSVTNTDGSVIMRNGSVYKDGCLFLDNGIKVERDGKVIMPDGSIKKDTKVVINNDHTVTVNDKYDLAIDDFTIVIWDMQDNKKLIDKNLKFPTVYSKDVVNILVAGLDHHTNKKNGKQFSRADSIILVSIDKVGKTVNIISISRATLVAINGHGKHRLNESYQYGGADLLVDTIQENFKIKIDYYMAIDFNLFIKTVDIFGGVKLELTDEETEFFKDYLDSTGQKIAKGAKYHFDGKEALLYAKLRKIDSDRARTVRQRKIVYNLLEKANSLTLDQIYKLYNEVYKNIDTNMSPLSVLRRLPLILSAIHWENTGFAIPRQPSQLIRNDDGYDVLMIYWPTEVSYLRSVLYKNVDLKIWKKQE